MYLSTILLLIGAAVPLIPAQSTQPASIKFCFNGGETNESCITTQTTFEDAAACKRVPVLDGPGQTITLSKVFVLPSFNAANTTACQIFSDGNCTTNPSDNAGYSPCARNGWTNINDDGSGECKIVADTQAVQKGNGTVVMRHSLGSWRCTRSD